MLRARFQDWHLPDEVKRLVLHRTFPSVLSRTFFEFGRLVHGELLGAGGNLRIGRRQISAGDLQINGRQFSGLVLGVQESCGLRPVIVMQTLLFTRQFIMNVIPSAFFAAVESESSFHSCSSQR
jgi:hypothetical protein